MVHSKVEISCANKFSLNFFSRRSIQARNGNRARAKRLGVKREKREKEQRKKLKQK